MIQRKFKFFKNEKGEWYLVLPEWNGDPADLQMIEGADEWLELVSNKANEVAIFMSERSFKGADTLTLLRIREANLGGGGIYYLETYQNKKVELKLWLCDVTEFVFKAIPQKIYFSHSA